MTSGSEAGVFSYNLVREPWIPCERLDGASRLVGIEEALVNAHELAGVHDESPLVTATIHRLLLAILHRVFAPHGESDWVALWERGHFDAVRVREYLSRWESRFDLFEPVRPFLQVANLRGLLNDERDQEPKLSEAWQLALESSNHCNVIALLEAKPTAPALTAASAARVLLAYMAYAPCGMTKNDATSTAAGLLRGGAVVLVRGENLQRTLLLNLVWKFQRDIADKPPWERDEATQRTTRSPRGMVDLLVWQSRRVELLPERDYDGSIVVRRACTGAGERLLEPYPDPMFSYVVRDEKKGPVPIRIDSARAVWRDSASLFDVAVGRNASRCPLACTQLETVTRHGIARLSRATRLSTDFLGLAGRGSEATIRLWRTERVVLPVAILSDAHRLTVLRTALARGDELGRGLQERVLRQLAEDLIGQRPRDQYVPLLVDVLRAMPAFWGLLGQAFVPWLSALGDHEDPDAALVDWNGQLRVTSRRVVRGACGLLGGSGRALRAEAMADRELGRLLNNVLDKRSGSNPRSKGAFA